MGGLLEGLLGCRYPVIQAGMGGVARSGLVAAVSGAGAFGCLGMVREPVALLEREVAAVRARTDRPFGVNLIPASTPPDLLAAQVDAVIALQVPVVFGFWTLDRDLIDRLKAAGRTVVWQVGRVDEAEAAVRAGVDALVVQGVEAGGHVRGQVPALSLVGTVMQAVDVPVAVAGGICDGQAMARALSRGADGVVCGSLFLAATESFAHDLHKQALVAASGRDTVLTDLFMRNWPDGAAVRVLRRPAMDLAGGRMFGHRAVDMPPTVIGADDGQPVRAFSTHSPLRSTTGDLEAMPLYAGQGIDAIGAVRPAGDIVADLVTEARAAFDAMSAAASGPGASLSSPPCLMHTLAPVETALSKAATIDALNELIEAERAGAIVCTRYSATSGDRNAARILRGMAHAESHWVAMLSAHVRRLGGAPSGATGSFREKAMRRQTTDERLAFLNRGQGWVSDRLGQLAGQVADDRLRADLVDMRRAHDDGIAVCETLLAGRAGGRALSGPVR